MMGFYWRSRRGLLDVGVLTKHKVYTICVDMRQTPEDPAPSLLQPPAVDSTALQPKPDSLLHIR